MILAHERQKLHEPELREPRACNCMSALKAAYRAFAYDLRLCGDSSTLDALVASHRPLLRQLKRDWPGAFYGDGGDIPNLPQTIANLRNQFATKELTEWLS